MKATPLARVRTPTPRLLALHATTTASGGGGGGGGGADASAVRVVAQIRATLLHYVRDGVLMCVISSPEEICGVTQCDAQRSFQLIVTARSGALWLVQLPSTRMGVKPLVLRDSAGGAESVCGDAFVRRIGVVPGAQQPCYLASLDVLVCTSLLVPTTIVLGLLRGASQREFELDDLEGERSTCLCVFSTDDADHPRLASCLLGNMPPSVQAITIVQGDADGAVRCAVVEVSSGRLVEQVKELVRLPEAVHSICPVRLETGIGANALLVVGSRGSVVLLSHGATYPRVLYGHVGVSVTSVAILDGDKPALAFTTAGMKTFVISVTQVLAQLHADVKKSIKSKTLASTTTELSEVEDALSVCAHAGPDTVLSLLSRSGYLVSMLDDEITTNHDSSPTSKTDVTAPDQHVKTLLKDISHLSEKSTKLQEISERADALLHGLKTAYQLVRLVEEHGVGSVITCSLRLKLVDAGWAMQFKGVRLLFTLRLNELLQPPELISSGMWRVQLTVQTASGDRVASYGFPLCNCFDKERWIELDDSIIQQQDGVVQVCCELVFAPRIVDVRELKSREKWREHPQDVKKLVSIGIPVARTKELHLVQLCEPTSNFPVNPVAVRDQFVQAHKPGLNRSDQHGYEWWTTLFEDTALARNVLPPEGIDEAHKPIPPPLRVTTRILCDRVAPVSGAAMKEEDVIRLLSRFFAIESDIEREQWRQSCRFANGKWWIGLRTFTANLIVLRFATSGTGRDDGNTPQQDRVDVTAYASHVADLAAIRALILNDCCAKEEVGCVKGIHQTEFDLEQASIALMKTRTQLDSLATAIADICEKSRSAGLSESHGDGHDAVNICQDELLQLLQRTSQVETRALELYWKSREVLSQHLTF